MGNQSSSSASSSTSKELDFSLFEDAEIGELLDVIFTNFMFAMEIQELENFHSTDYCDQVSILTKQWIEHKFSDQEIRNLEKRITQGSKPDPETFYYQQVSNYLQNQFNPPKKSLFLPTANISSSSSFVNETKKENNDTMTTTMMMNPEEKEQKCEQIAKFYINIAHVYVSIVKALNPSFVAEDPITKEKKYYPFNFPRDKLPPNVKLESQEDGFCMQRIRKLMEGSLTKEEKKEKNMPSIVINQDNDNGFEELTQLYYDQYDDDGTPSMSPKNQQQYQQDVLTFARAFQKPSQPPPTSFRDIKLKSYQPIEFSNMPATSSSSAKTLLEDYSEILRSMLSFTKGQHQKLKDILKEIFELSTKEKEKEKENEKSDDNEPTVRIHSELTVASLDKLIVKTRQLLIELFYQCEDYFQTALQIYEALAQTHVLDSEFENIFTKQQEQEAPELENFEIK